MFTQANRISDRCDEAISGCNLLDHPFYRRWTDGTLPVPALKDYAREYGAFVRVIGEGWETVGKPDFARVEDAHAEVWENSFAAGLETSVAAPQVTQVADLVAISRELFARPATALGALYAFEVQQPVVAEAKLRGLAGHYPQLPAECGEYFRLHCDGYDEVSLLAEAMDALDPDDQAQAVAACGRMGRALYDALTGIDAPYVAAAA